MLLIFSEWSAKPPWPPPSFPQRVLLHPAAIDGPLFFCLLIFLFYGAQRGAAFLSMIC